MIIYWSTDKSSKDFLLGMEEPSSAFLDFKQTALLISEKTGWNDFTKCPSIIEFSKNLFSIKSPIDIEFSWDGNDLHFDDDADIEFLRSIISVRDMGSGMISMSLSRYIFFSEESCELQFSSPSLITNEFIENCTILPGQFSISSWFRPLDLGFIIRHKNKKIKIKKGDTLFNVRFLTNDNVKLKKFYFTNVCEEISHTVTSYKNSQSGTLKEYFKKMYLDFNKSKIKKKLIKEIKDNVLE